ncbi:MAG: CesT family type III secretion system chaperone [Planctomycetaceae bacterium]
MNWLEQVLKEIGDDLGVGPIELDENRSARLQVDADILGIEHRGEEVLIYLSGALAVPDEDSWLRRLELVHYNRRLPRGVQLAVAPENQLVALSRCHDREFSHPVFLQTWDMLTQLVSDCRQAS